jgi:hypothetical protein
VATPASHLTDHTAILNGAIGEQEPIVGSYWWEWGTTTEYGDENLPSHFEVRFLPDFKMGRVSFPVAELEPGTTYHYRLCTRAGEGAAPSCSADQQFTTPTDHPTEPRIFLTEVCRLEPTSPQPPSREPLYMVFEVMAGLPPGEKVTGAINSPDQGRFSATVNPDGTEGWGGYGPFERGSTVELTAFNDEDEDFNLDPGETVYGNASITDLCSDFPQEG